MKVSFESLRDEVMETAGLEPFVIELPGKAKDIVITGVPTRVFMETLNVQEGDPSVALMWEYLKKLCPDKDWPRLSKQLNGEDVLVLSGLVMAINKHFGLIFGDTPKESDSSEE